MRPSRIDVIVFVYTLGATLSGALVSIEVGSADRVFLVLVSLVIAAPWTVYFRWEVMPRLVDQLETNEESESSADGS